MAARRFFYVAAGVFLLAGAFALGSVTATSRTERAISEAGRYQLVTGGPEVFGGAILLDSATGQTYAWQPLVMSDTDYSYWNEYGLKGMAAAVEARARIEAGTRRP